MPEKLPSADVIWDRKKWQEQRKKNGDVPKGAAMTVSIGDALDKFHKESAKGIKDGMQSAIALKKALATYKSAIKTKYSKFHGLIVKFFDTKIVSYEKEAKAVLDGIPNYGKFRAAACDEMIVTGAEFQHWEKNGSQGTFKATNLKKLEKALTDFLGVVTRAVYYSDKITVAQRIPFDQAVLHITAGHCEKGTVEGLVKMLKAFPNSIA